MPLKPSRHISHIFGPVPSRRLGRSLGVDLIPAKTCTFDCIYCQIGRTDAKTVRRDEFVPLDEVLAELLHALSNNTKPDYITLAGSGEPTLYNRLGELIDRIHELTDVPVAILTNGSQFCDPQLREEVGRADLIVPSLDAGDEKTFLLINRPADTIGFEQYVSGLRDFCKRFGSKVWLEVFLLSGVNASDEQVSKIAAIARDLRVARIQLNTAVRPTAEIHARPIDENRLRELARMFQPPAEVVADFSKTDSAGAFEVTSEMILQMLRRRPCTLEDIAAGLNANPVEIGKTLDRISRTDRIKTQRRQGRLYYSVFGVSSEN